MADESVRNSNKPLSQEQQMLLTEVQGLETDFVNLCSRIGKSRELSLAITNMEQAAMWAFRQIIGK